MNTRNSVFAVIGPVLIMMVLLTVVLLSHRGMSAVQHDMQLTQLPLSGTEKAAEVFAPQERKSADALVLTGTEDVFHQTLTDTLDLMDYSYQELELSKFEGSRIGDVSMVLVCTMDLSQLDGEDIVSLFDWVEAGGRLALMTAPNADGAFRIFSQKLGIDDMDDGYIPYSSFRYEEGALPVFGTRVFDVDLQDVAMEVRLGDDCEVYMRTADTHSIPLLWAVDRGQGRVAVFNASLMQGKEGRGHALQVLYALCENLCYPVINAGMVFVDDFPAPQPAGFDERLRDQFGYDVQGFYRNHWWPDMKELVWKYGVQYTGVLVETYNDVVEPPFEPDNEDRSLIQYYMSELLQSGGEVGLHGYNHQPLCPDGFEYAGEDYATWSSIENMQLATKELVRYGKSILPYNSYTTYVPPSNYLSEEGQIAILAAEPGITTISGLFLPEVGTNALTQEFEETADYISVPRISSGFSVDAYNDLVISYELLLQGVYSHFIHPDDVLDVERGADLGWNAMYADFDALLERIVSAYPALRWCTASEGAAAVQRYDRLNVMRSWEGQTLHLQLDGFYDEAWLALLCDTPPQEVTNAEIYEMSEGLYWLRAMDNSVQVTWES